MKPQKQTKRYDLFAVTLAGNADAGAVHVWGACGWPASDQVRPSPTKKILM
jgi:hypothetical protein